MIFLVNNTSLIDRIIELDKEIDKILKEITHGLPQKLFRKKIVLALFEKNIIGEVHEILSHMGNVELAMTLNLTKHIIGIEYIPKYMTEAFIDFKKIKEDPNYLINEYYRLVEQHKTIMNISNSKENYEIVKSRANIEKIEEYLLHSMNNEQINELANTSDDWNKKLYYYGFLKDKNEEQCKFKKQKNGKYYVIKVKYITVKDKNEYLYICNDDSIKKGNKVMVSSYIGYPLELKVAKVIESKYYNFEELPISIDDSEEVIAKVNSEEKLSAFKYSFGNLKCLKNGKEVPIFDPNLDRQSSLTSIKIANEVTNRLDDKTKSMLFNIPNFELVPRKFKQEIIDKYISLENDEIKEIDGLEDEICDYVLFNIKHEDCYNLINEIVNEVIANMEELTFENLLKNTFKENNGEYIKYIMEKYVIEKHKNIECDDEWLAGRIFDTLIVKIQLINKTMLEEEKYKHSLYRYNFREVDRKLVVMRDIRDTFNNIGIKNLTNPFIGYVFIDSQSGLNVRIVGNLGNEKLNKMLCTKKKVCINNISFLNYETILFEDEINTYDLEQQMKKYYSFENIENGRNQTEIDNLRNKENPDYVEIVFPYKKKIEKYSVRLVDYVKEDKLYVVSFRDKYATCKYEVLDDGEEILLFNEFLK